MKVKGEVSLMERWPCKCVYIETWVKFKFSSPPSLAICSKMRNIAPDYLIKEKLSPSRLHYS